MVPEASLVYGSRSVDTGPTPRDSKALSDAIMNRSRERIRDVASALLHLNERTQGVPTHFNDRLRGDLRLNFVLVRSKDDEYYINYMKAMLEEERVTRFYLMARGERWIDKAARISRTLRDDGVLYRGLIRRGYDDTPDGSSVRANRDSDGCQRWGLEPLSRQRNRRHRGGFLRVKEWAAPLARPLILKSTSDGRGDAHKARLSPGRAVWRCVRVFKD